MATGFGVTSGTVGRGYYAIRWMKVVALAGGIGAGKFLRGLSRASLPATSPPCQHRRRPDAARAARLSRPRLRHVLAGRTRSTASVGGDAATRRSGPPRSSGAFEPRTRLVHLGDLDLATHLYRTACSTRATTLSEAIARVAARFGVRARILPMSDDPVETRIDVVDARLGAADLHFQEYWVRRGGRRPGEGRPLRGARDARPAPGVLEAIAAADAIVLVSVEPGRVDRSDPRCPRASARRSRHGATRVVGVSGIVAGAPLAGMADKLMPAVGIEVSAAGVAAHYARARGAWLVSTSATRALAATGVGSGDPRARDTTRS